MSARQSNIISSSNKLSGGLSGHPTRARRAALRGRRAASAILAVGALGLAGCGESSEEKAAKQVCSATKEITAQIHKLQTIPISAEFLNEAKSSVTAIGTSLTKIKEAEANLPTARKEELDAATRAFQVEIARITGSVASAAHSANLQSALKSAEPQIKAALNSLATSYQKAFEALKCS
jgi:hypothetical protein